MPRARLPPIPLHEVHSLELSPCSASKVSLDIPRLTRLSSLDSVGGPFRLAILTLVGSVQ